MKGQIKLSANRQNGKTIFEFEMDECLKNLFLGKPDEIKESEKWKGLKFYSLQSKLADDPTYKNLLDTYNLIDNFGDTLFYFSSPTNRLSYRFNIAFLRTVGGRGKITISDKVPFSLMATGLKNCLDFIKEYHKTFLSSYKINGSITAEI